MYWMLKPAKIIATILEITLIIFLLIIFSDFAAINKIINVVINAAIKAAIPTDCFTKSGPVELTETITDVIAAGPASKGVASGKILSLSDVKLTLSSFLSCLLPKSISKAMINKIIPPAIVKAGNDIFK
jgi:hypothetical protein